MSKKQKHLLIAIFVGVVVLFLNRSYIQSRISEGRPKKEVKVVVARKAIRAGTPLATALVKTQTVPDIFAPKVAITSAEYEDYRGQPLGVDVLAGDYVLETYFKPISAAGPTLSAQLEEKDGQNYRAISLPVDETNSFARSIVTGDTIDIVFTFTAKPLRQKMSILLLQNIPVVSTGSYSLSEQELGTRGSQVKRYNTLTLRVSAEDAMRLNYARQNGKIDILLRSPKDNRMVDMKPIGNVLDLLNPADREQVKLAEQNQLEAARLEEARFKDQVKQLLDQQRAQQRGR